MNLAKLGHIARGVNQGIMDFQQMQANELSLQDRQRRMGLADADAQWEQQLRGRQQQQWRREDEQRALDQEAQAAGMKAIEEDRAAYDNTPAPLGLDGKPGEKSPYAPSKKAILRAAQAQQDLYFRKGRADLGMAMDTKLEPMRASIKGEAANGVMNAMRTGRDITPALREFDGLNNDGFDIDGSVEPIEQPDGTTAYKVKRKNRFTGKAMEQVVSQRQLVEAMAANIGKPEDAAKFNQNVLLESLKSRLNIEEKTHAANEDIRKEGVMQSNRMTLERERTAGDIRVKNTRGAASTAERTEIVRLLREERLAADSEVKNVTALLKEARSADRPALKAQLAEAQNRVREIGQKISDYADEKRAAPAAKTGKSSGNPPSIDSFFRR